MKFQCILFYVGFEVLKVVVMKSFIFWDITPCSLLKMNRYFRGTCPFYIQGHTMNPARNQCEEGSMLASKYHLTFNRLLSITSQKTELFSFILVPNK
jgi:hypothetical protein